MEINKKGDSYLAQITVGTACIVRHLIASDIKDGVVKLHFGRGSTKEMPNDSFFEVWIIGTGSGVESRGGMDLVFCGNSWPDAPPPHAKIFGLPEKDHVFFIKGTWTHDLAEASEIAEKSQIEALTTSLQKVSDQLELSKPAPHLVADDQ
jgi:hypothetical protein